MPAGRPKVMKESVLQKLEEAFSNGASDKEAIFIAGISSATFYSYCQAHPEFLERKEQLKDMIKYQARKNIKNKIFDGDLDTSRWYSERKMKEEFSTRSELTGSEGKPISVSFDSSFNKNDPSSQAEADSK